MCRRPATTWCFPLIGTITEQKIAVNAGATALSDTINSYVTVPAIPVMGTPTAVFTAASTTTGQEVDGTALPSRTVSYLYSSGSPAYDSYGNNLQVVETVSDGASKRTDQHVVQSAIGLRQRSCEPVDYRPLETDAVVVSTVGSSQITRESTFGYDPSDGIVNKEIIEPTAATCNGNMTACKRETDYTLDAFGQRHIETLSGYGFASRTSIFTRDANGTFVVSVTNALNQPDATDYSGLNGKSFGVPTGHTDLNGNVTAWNVDTFGRQTLQTLPGVQGPKAGTSYQYCAGINGGTATCTPSHAAFEVVSTPYAHDGLTQNGPMTITYYDALSRVVAMDAQGYDGPQQTSCGTPCWTRAATDYDAAGNVHESSRPYFMTGGTAAYTVNDYTDPLGDPDPYGRVWLVTHPDTSLTHYAYTALGSQGSQTSITNALSANHRDDEERRRPRLGDEERAPEDDVVSLRCLWRPADRDRPAGEPDCLYLRHPRLQALVQGSDLGYWTYTYDAVDDLLGQVDPNQRAGGTSTAMTYDALGRMLTAARRRIRPMAGSTTPPPTASGCLLRRRASNASYSRTHTYDTLSRPKKITLVVNGVNKFYTRTYNSDNRIDTLTYPSGFVVKYVYTAFGYLPAA